MVDCEQYNSILGSAMGIHLLDGGEAFHGVLLIHFTSRVSCLEGYAQKECPKHRGYSEKLQFFLN